MCPQDTTEKRQGAVIIMTLNDFVQRPQSRKVTSSCDINADFSFVKKLVLGFFLCCIRSYCPPFSLLSLALLWWLIRPHVFN